MTAKQIIEQAKAEANERFERYLVGFNDEMTDTTTDTLKARLEAEKKAYRRQPMYDVRNEPRMTNFINMVIDSGVEVPYQKTNLLPCFGDTVSNTGILTSLLTTQYLHLKGIEHLKTLLAPGHQVPEQLSHDQIALIHYYNGITITEYNASDIATSYKWTAKTSGRKIWQQYLYFTSNANRNAIPNNPTPTTKRNKLKLFESVLPYLNDTGKQKAEYEIKVLKIKLEED